MLCYCSKVMHSIYFPQALFGDICYVENEHTCVLQGCVEHNSHVEKYYSRAAVCRVVVVHLIY